MVKEVGYLETDELPLEKVRPFILPCLVNEASNKGLTVKGKSGLVNRRFGDLYIMYRIFGERIKDGRLSAKITNGLLAKWGISEEELYDIAVTNLDKVGYEIFPLSEIFGAMGICDIPEQDPIAYVVADKECLYGATLILNKDIMKAIEGKLGKTTYVIPSSVHELIFVSEKCDKELIDSLKQGIVEVNSTMSADDILSDHLYRYNNESGELLST